MTIAVIAVIVGLSLLVWSADLFVEGSASTARHFGMSPLLIGMVIVGFGTSAPEMVVSALAASQGNPGIALGNAYGSNITNIALILGVTALISPIAVDSQVLRKELPILTVVTVLAAWQLWDGEITRLDAIVLLVGFGGLMAWIIRQGLRKKEDALGSEMEQKLEVHSIPIRRAVFWLVGGLVLLIVSSRILVWGAVEIAYGFGVGDLIVGLTIVAVGTSLPELASSVIAARKGEHDIALGNILGSNLFSGHCRCDSSNIGRAGGFKPGHAGHGRTDPVAVRHRLRFPGTGTYQPGRGGGAAGLLPGLYDLLDQYGFRRTGIGATFPANRTLTWNLCDPLISRIQHLYAGNKKVLTAEKFPLN
jgi:cation:H+ antiporter